MPNAQNPYDRSAPDRHQADKSTDKQAQSEWSSRKVAPESDNRSSTRAHGSEDKADKQTE